MRGTAEARFATWSTVKDFALLAQAVKFVHTPDSVLMQSTYTHISPKADGVEEVYSSLLISWFCATDQKLFPPPAFKYRKHSGYQMNSHFFTKTKIISQSLCSTFLLTNEYFFHKFRLLASFLTK